MNNTLFAVCSESFDYLQVLGVFDTKEDAQTFQTEYELNCDVDDEGYTQSLWVIEVKYNPEPPSTDHLEQQQ